MAIDVHSDLLPLPTGLARAGTDPVGPVSPTGATEVAFDLSTGAEAATQRVLQPLGKPFGEHKNTDPLSSPLPEPTDIKPSEPNPFTDLVPPQSQIEDLLPPYTDPKSLLSYLNRLVSRRTHGAVSSLFQLVEFPPHDQTATHLSTAVQDEFRRLQQHAREHLTRGDPVGKWLLSLTDWPRLLPRPQQLMAVRNGHLLPQNPAEARVWFDSQIAQLAPRYELAGLADGLTPLITHYRSQHTTQALLQQVNQQLAALPTAERGQPLYGLGWSELLTPEERGVAVYHQYLVADTKTDLYSALSAALPSVLKPGEDIGSLNRLAEYSGTRANQIGNALNELLAVWKKAGRIADSLIPSHWTQVLETPARAVASRNGLVPTRDAQMIKLLQIWVSSQLADQYAQLGGQVVLPADGISPMVVRDSTLTERRNQLHAQLTRPVVDGVSLQQAFRSPAQWSLQHWQSPAVQQALQQAQSLSQQLLTGTVAALPSQWQLPRSVLEQQVQSLVQTRLDQRHGVVVLPQDTAMRLVANFMQNLTISLVTGGGMVGGGAMGTALAPAVGTMIGATGGGLAAGLLAVVVTRTLAQAMIDAGGYRTTVEEWLGPIGDDVTAMMASMAAVGGMAAAGQLGATAVSAAVIGDLTGAMTELAARMPSYLRLLKAGHSWPEVLGLMAKDAAQSLAIQAAVTGAVTGLGHAIRGGPPSLFQEVVFRPPKDMTLEQAQALTQQARARLNEIDYQLSGNARLSEQKLRGMVRLLAQFEQMNVWIMRNNHNPKTDWLPLLVNWSRLNRVREQAEQLLARYATPTADTRATPGLVRVNDSGSSRLPQATRSGDVRSGDGPVGSEASGLRSDAVRPVVGSEGVPPTLSVTESIGPVGREVTLQQVNPGRDTVAHTSESSPDGDKSPSPLDPAYISKTSYLSRMGAALEAAMQIRSFEDLLDFLRNFRKNNDHGLDIILNRSKIRIKIVRILKIKYTEADTFQAVTQLSNALEEQLYVDDPYAFNILLKELYSIRGLRLCNLILKDKLLPKPNDVLSYANLSRLNLAGIENFSLNDVNLSSAVLTGATLSGVSMQRADLSGADIQSAMLIATDLQYANLTQANLQGANLQSANLSNATLSRADLRGADLDKADLRGAELANIQHNTATKWTGVKLTYQQVIELMRIFPHPELQATYYEVLAQRYLKPDIPLTIDIQIGLQNFSSIFFETQARRYLTPLIRDDWIATYLRNRFNATQDEAQAALIAARRANRADMRIVRQWVNAVRDSGTLELTQWEKIQPLLEVRFPHTDNEAARMLLRLRADSQIQFTDDSRAAMDAYLRSRGFDIFTQVNGRWDYQEMLQSNPTAASTDVLRVLIKTGLYPSESLIIGVSEFDTTDSDHPALGPRQRNLDSNLYYNHKDAAHAVWVAGITGANLPIQVIKLHSDDVETPSGNKITSKIKNLHAQGGRVLNISHTITYETMKTIKDILAEYPDFIFVIAAGNSTHFMLPNQAYKEKKGSVDSVAYLAELPNVIIVGASNEHGGLADFSNSGPEVVDLAAPGVDQWAPSIDNGYEHANGTSGAAPQVAQTVALMLYLYPELTAEQIRGILVATVLKSPELTDQIRWGGVLQPNDAILVVALLRLMQQGVTVERALSLVSPVSSQTSSQTIGQQQSRPGPQTLSNDVQDRLNRGQSIQAAINGLGLTAEEKNRLAELLGPFSLDQAAAHLGLLTSAQAEAVQTFATLQSQHSGLALIQVLNTVPADQITTQQQAWLQDRINTLLQRGYSAESVLEILNTAAGQSLRLLPLAEQWYRTIQNS